MSHKHTENSSEKTRQFHRSRGKEAHVADKDMYQTACSVIHKHCITTPWSNEDDGGSVMNKC